MCFDVACICVLFVCLCVFSVLRILLQKTFGKFLLKAKNQVVED
jgi:hypothetical protein